MINKGDALQPVVSAQLCTVVFRRTSMFEILEICSIKYDDMDLCSESPRTAMVTLSA